MVTPRAKKASGSMLAVGPVMRISAPGLAICSRPGRVLFRMVTPVMTSRSADRPRGCTPQPINGYCRSLGKGAALDDLRLAFPAFVHQAFGGVSVVAVPLHFEPDDIGAHIRWRACISPAVLVLRVEKALHIVTAQAYDAIVDRGCGLLDAVLYLSGGIAHFNVLALYWPALVGTVSPVGSVTNTPPFFTWQVMMGVTPALNAPVSGAVVFQVGRTPQKFFTAVPFDLRDVLHHLSGSFVGVVHAGLVLAVLVIALPVLHRGVDDMEVGQQLLGDGVALRYIEISSFMRR